VQGAITDLGEIGSMSAVRASFVLPLTCFVVIALYGFRAYRSHAEPAT
jgi:FHS family L-fucose permease-like MFS transporter